MATLDALEYKSNPIKNEIDGNFGICPSALKINNLEIETSWLSSRKQTKPQLSNWTNVCDERFWLLGRQWTNLCMCNRNKPQICHQNVCVTHSMNGNLPCLHGVCVYYYHTVCTLCLPFSSVGSTFFSFFFLSIVCHASHEKRNDWHRLYLHIVCFRHCWR